MSLAHYKHGGLRDTEALLYDDILKLLLWRWEESKLDGDEDTPQLRQLLREAGRGEADLRVTLAKLAFETYTEAIKLRPTDTVADITESRLREAIAGLKQNDWGWAQRVIDSMKLRAGLMLERYPGLFSFPHRRLQEYLVASDLAGFKDFGIRAAELFVQNIVWREIILLAVGTLVDLDGESDRPLALVGELCPNRSCVSAMDWEKTLLATDVLIS